MFCSSSCQLAPCSLPCRPVPFCRYIAARADAAERRRHLLYERALKALPGSYKVSLCSQTHSAAVTPAAAAAADAVCSQQGRPALTGPGSGCKAFQHPGLLPSLASCILCAASCHQVVKVHLHDVTLLGALWLEVQKAGAQASPSRRHCGSSSTSTST